VLRELSSSKYGSPSREWNAAYYFSGPEPKPLDVLAFNAFEFYVQVLNSTDITLFSKSSEITGGYRSAIKIQAVNYV